MSLLYDTYKDKEFFQQEAKDYEYDSTGSLQKQLQEKLEEFQKRSIDQDSEISRLKMQFEKQTMVISQLLLQFDDLQQQFDALKKQQPAEEAIEIRDIPMQQIKEEMLVLLSDKKTRYADEIATELKLDIGDVIEAFRQLQEEGKLFIDETKL